MRRAALVAALLAGCGGGDAPSCEDTVRRVNERLGDADVGMVAKCKAEKWSPALRSCLVGVKDEDGVIGCFAKHDDTRSLKKDKANEAERELARLEKAIKQHVAVEGQLPIWQADRTPATPCCNPGRKDFKCEPDPTLWSSSPWHELDFSIDEPHQLQYELEASGDQVTVRAIGDLDCDSNEVVYELIAELTGGQVTTSLTRPSGSD